MDVGPVELINGLGPFMYVTEVPPRFRGSLYDYQRSSPQFSWTSLWLSAKFPPDFMDLLMIISGVPPRFHGPPYDYQRSSSQISRAFLWLSEKNLPDFVGPNWLSAKFLPDFRGILMIISKVLLLLAMFVPDLVTGNPQHCLLSQERNPVAKKIHNRY